MSVFNPGALPGEGEGQGVGDVIAGAEFVDGAIARRTASTAVVGRFAKGHVAKADVPFKGLEWSVAQTDLTDEANVRAAVAFVLAPFRRSLRAV